MDVQDVWPHAHDVQDVATCPYQTEANPKGQTQNGQFGMQDIKGKGHEQVEAITTLRLCRQVDNKVKAPKRTDSRRDEPTIDDEQNEREPIKQTSTTVGDTSPNDPPPRTFISKAPYPQESGSPVS